MILSAAKIGYFLISLSIIAYASRKVPEVLSQTLIFPLVLFKIHVHIVKYIFTDERIPSQ